MTAGIAAATSGGAPLRAWCTVPVHVRVIRSDRSGG